MPRCAPTSSQPAPPSLAAGLLLAAALGVSLVATASAQQPVRDNPAREQPQQMGSGIRGRVVDIATNRVLPKTRVTLFSATGEAPPPVFTDANGVFGFQPLAAGHYTLLAEKTGYARMRYGARAELDPPAEIDIEPGSAPEELLVHLTKGAAIFGRVYDEFGDPIVGGEVSVSAAQVVGDAIRTVPISRPAALTNDLGQYRVGDLPPGRYYVTLAAGSLGSTAPGTPREWERLAPWSKTFYPGAAAFSDATAIVLGPAEERAGVDFPVRSHERAQVRLSAHGVATPATGSSVGPNDAQIRMWFFSADGDSPSNGRQMSLSGNAGGDMTAIALPNFPINEPGDWTVLARSGLRADVETFHLSAGDDYTIDLNFQPASRVAGRVVFDGSLARPDLSTISISVAGAGVDRAIPGRLLLPTPRTPRPDGTFALPDLAGTIDIQAVPPAGWYLIAATHAGRDLLDDPLVLKPGEDVSDVELVFSDRVGAIAGNITLPDGTPAPGCAVAVFPDEATMRFGGRRMRLTRADQHGQFMIRDLPSGAYRAAAVLEIDAASWLTSAAIDRLRPMSSPVVVDARGRQSVTLPCVVNQ